MDERTRRWRAKPEVKEHLASYMREWRAENREKVRASNKKWRDTNPDRVRKKAKDWRTGNPERIRDHNLKNGHGIVGRDYDRMSAAQDGKCHICEAMDVKLCVDHDHDTGEIRKLLCRTCNMLVGFFEKHPERMQATAWYVQLYGDGLLV